MTGMWFVFTHLPCHKTEFMPQSFRPKFSHLLSLASVLMLAPLLTGCRQDMHDQPKMYPQRSASLFPDGRSVRPQASGTVARSQLQQGNYFNTGMIDGVEGDGLPFKVDTTVLQRGQERYNIYCMPCHSRVGNGKGMIVQRGYYPAASFHSDRLRRAPLGHFFSVITNGYGAMPDYAAQLSPQDRWAVVAYVRALQLSQGATDADVPHGQTVLPINVLVDRAGFAKDFLGSWVDAGAQKNPAIPVTVPSTSPTSGNEPASAVGKTMSNAEGNKPQAQGSQPGVPVHSQGNAANGKTIYAANCSVCHQPTRAGMPPVFPSLIGVVDRVGEARVRTVARTGIPDAKPPMPPHPNLTDKDITDLIAFLRTK
jgi:mono/diheme cytochrome c family protein